MSSMTNHNRLQTLGGILVAASIAALVRGIGMCDSVVIALGATAILVGLLFLFVPHECWLASWHGFLGIPPIYWVRLVCYQHSHPSRFLHVQNAVFIFLPLDGGVNGRTWKYHFNIVSCLLHDIRVHTVRLAIRHLGKEIEPEEAATLEWEGKEPKELCVQHLSITPVGGTETLGNLTDTMFNYLAAMVRGRKSKFCLPLSVSISGYRHNVLKFCIRGGGLDHAESYQAVIEDWGTNNP